MSTEKKRSSKLVTPPREYSEKTMDVINQGAGNVFAKLQQKESNPVELGPKETTEIKQVIAQIKSEKTAAKERGEFEVKVPRRDRFSEAFKEALSKNNGNSP